MLSYQHHYHAGNFADVLKHWLLVECLAHMAGKDKPFDYIDTHAGAGLYRLDSAAARKTGESAAGVLRLDWQRLPQMALYHQAVAADLAARRYPGSALLARRMLREGDRGWLFELHPKTIVELRRCCAPWRGARVLGEDGLQEASRLLPNRARRALLLVDPPYELKSDYRDVVDLLARCYRKMPQTVMLLWYPVTERRRINHLEQTVRASGLRNVALYELGVLDDTEPGMTASGMLVVNPPWTLSATVAGCIAELATQLSQDGKPRYRQQQLVSE
jgi:23S rRNA (adenine2030-N6)-methyltransferase